MDTSNSGGELRHDTCTGTHGHESSVGSGKRISQKPIRVDIQMLLREETHTFLTVMGNIGKKMKKRTRRWRIGRRILWRSESDSCSMIEFC